MKSEIKLASWGVVSVYSEIMTSYLRQFSNISFITSVIISYLQIVHCFTSTKQQIALTLNANRVHVTNALPNFWMKFPAVISKNDVLGTKATHPVVQNSVRVAVTITFCVIV